MQIEISRKINDLTSEIIIRNEIISDQKLAFKADKNT